MDSSQDSYSKQPNYIHDSHYVNFFVIGYFSSVSDFNNYLATKAIGLSSQLEVLEISVNQNAYFSCNTILSCAVSLMAKCYSLFRTRVIFLNWGCLGICMSLMNLFKALNFNLLSTFKIHIYPASFQFYLHKTLFNYMRFLCFNQSSESNQLLNANSLVIFF